MNPENMYLAQLHVDCKLFICRNPTTYVVQLHDQSSIFYNVYLVRKKKVNFILSCYTNLTHTGQEKITSFFRMVYNVQHKATRVLLDTKRNHQEFIP